MKKNKVKKNISKKSKESSKNMMKTLNVLLNLDTKKSKKVKSKKKTTSLGKALKKGLKEAVAFEKGKINLRTHIVSNDSPKVYREYVGLLDTHWETGYEDGIFAHLYVDGFETPNPNYNPEDPKMGPKIYRDYNGMLSLDIKDEIEIIDCKLYPEYNGHKFLIGRSFELRGPFGRAYPINVDLKTFDINKWHQIFNVGTTKAKVRKLIKSVALYGGTFDPVHKGHENIMTQLSYTYDQVLVLVGNNWTKNYQPLFSLDERIKSVEALTSKNLKLTVLDWAKNEDTSSTYEMALKVKKIYGIDPVIVIGTDNVDQLEKWKNWDKLKHFTFAIVERKGYELKNKQLLSQLRHIKIQGHVEISSTSIKESHDETQIPEESKKCLDLRKL